MRIFLPIHLNSGNRGCEAISKATSILLGIPSRDIIALSSDIELDERLGLGNWLTLQKRSENYPLSVKIKSKLIKILTRDAYRAECVHYSYRYDKFLNQIIAGDIVLSTGGDMLCYYDNEVIYINEYLYKKGVKSILWGCSIGENNLSKRKLETLKHFSLIYVRESLTKEMLNSKGLKNVVLFPDPAFILKPETCLLPMCFESNKVVGINLSNFVTMNYGLDSVYGKNVINMIDYIIQNTEYSVLLIPHVLWNSQDDRIISRCIISHFKNSDRISLLDTVKLNYCQIRYVISKCELFIGARTHSIISAYSTKVPALALGYSIKSKGIAKDLGLDKRLVVDCIHLKDANVLTEHFKYLELNKDSIKKHLQQTIPCYISNMIKLDDVKSLLKY